VGEGCFGSDVSQVDAIRDGMHGPRRSQEQTDLRSPCWLAAMAADTLRPPAGLPVATRERPATSRER
jgi:hypothetical protein